MLRLSISFPLSLYLAPDTPSRTLFFCHTTPSPIVPDPHTIVICSLDQIPHVLVTPVEITVYPKLLSSFPGL
jgi:hypothetical protein